MAGGGYTPPDAAAVCRGAVNPPRSSNIHEVAQRQSSAAAALHYRNLDGFDGFATLMFLPKIQELFLLDTQEL